MAELRHQVREALRRALGPPDEFTPRQIAQLTEIVRNVDRQSSPPLRQEASGAALDILDFYATSAPDPQVTVDLFAGEWASRFPAPLQDVKAGQATLFEAEMITWGVDRLGGVSGKRVMEMGPLGGGHTYMIDRLGAREIVAVEANSRAYLKCLLVKELLGIPSATFLYGDAIAYLEAEIARGAEPVDLCLASGVLYHMVNPVAALRVMTAISDNLLLWTMYWDDQIMKGHPELAGSSRFDASGETVCAHPLSSAISRCTDVQGFLRRGRARKRLAQPRGSVPGARSLRIRRPRYRLRRRQRLRRVPGSGSPPAGHLSQTIEFRRADDHVVISLRPTHRLRAGVSPRHVWPQSTSHPRDNGRPHNADYVGSSRLELMA